MSKTSQDTSSTQRGIDHLVMPVQDLAAARRFYEAAGFTATPDAVHPWGTGNFLIQMQGNFLEPLTVVAPEKIETHRPGNFSFGAFNRDFLKMREGISMLVFEGRDARTDQNEFADKGLQTYAPFDFERQAKLPNGSEVTVGFSLAFVTDSRIDQAAFFTCQQTAPQYFWKEEYQNHRNTAIACSEVMLCAEEPQSFRGFFAALHGDRSVKDEGDRLLVHTSRGNVSLATRQALDQRFPGGLGDGFPSSPFIAGFQITVRSLTAVRETLDAAGIPYESSADSVWIAPSQSFGALVAFKAAD